MEADGSDVASSMINLTLREDLLAHCIIVVRNGRQIIISVAILTNSVVAHAPTELSTAKSSIMAALANRLVFFFINIGN